MKRAFFNWSGGKDSAMALWQVLQNKMISVEYLLTSMNSFHNRVSMHGVRRELLEAQAAALQIPLLTVELPEQPAMSEYEDEMMKTVTLLKNEGISTSVFGDIFLEDLRKYREERMSALGIQCVFPIWKKNTGELMQEFIQSGFKAIVVCINEQSLDKSFCGRMVDTSFWKDLPANVDPCGENGEFHTFVFDGPIFHRPVSFTRAEIVHKEYAAPRQDEPGESANNYGFYFCDLVGETT